MIKSLLKSRRRKRKQTFKDHEKMKMNKDNIKKTKVEIVMNLSKIYKFLSQNMNNYRYQRLQNNNEK